MKENKEEMMMELWVMKQWADGKIPPELAGKIMVGFRCEKCEDRGSCAELKMFEQAAQAPMPPNQVTFVLTLLELLMFLEAATGRLPVGPHTVARFITKGLCPLCENAKAECPLKAAMEKDMGDDTLSGKKAVDLVMGMVQSRMN